MEEEADYLCGVPRYARSSKRTNHRMGNRKSTLRIHLGTIAISIPILRYFHSRVSMTKRARRLSFEIIEDLAHIYATGVMSGDAAALIKALWTLELSDELLDALVTKLTSILEQWRGRGAMDFQPMHFRDIDSHPVWRRKCNA